MFLKIIQEQSATWTFSKVDGQFHLKVLDLCWPPAYFGTKPKKALLKETPIRHLKCLLWFKALKFLSSLIFIVSFLFSRFAACAKKSLVDAFCRPGSASFSAPSSSHSRFTLGPFCHLSAEQACKPQRWFIDWPTRGDSGDATVSNKLAKLKRCVSRTIASGQKSLGPGNSFHGPIWENGLENKLNKLGKSWK